MSDFKTAMRRIITGDDGAGKSVIVIDGGPSSQIGDADIGGLFEIWEDAASGVLTTKDSDDLGATKPILGPRAGNFQVRWFVVNPLPEGVPKEALNAAVRERFADMGGAGHIIDQTRHPAMHETHSIDVICLLQGRVKLILEGAETIVEPGQVVIQRGTNHAWETIGGAGFAAGGADRPAVEALTACRRAEAFAISFLKKRRRVGHFSKGRERASSDAQHVSPQGEWRTRVTPRGASGACEDARSRRVALTARHESKDPLTQQARRARRMNGGPPDCGAARDRLTDSGCSVLTPRARDMSRRLPMQERPHRQTQNHKKRRHTCLLQKPAPFVPVLFFSGK